MKTLRDQFSSELADIYDAEGRIAGVLPTMTQPATSAPLEKAHGDAMGEVLKEK